MLEIAIDLGRFPKAPATLLERAVRTVFEAEGVGEGELSLALLVRGRDASDVQLRGRLLEPVEQGGAEPALLIEDAVPVAEIDLALQRAGRRARGHRHACPVELSTAS